MTEARWYGKIEDDAVRCELCRHRCVIAEGRRGICGVRRNDRGTLHALTYGRCIARHADPVEKKPLFHVLPGSRTWSIATMGCNFRCRHCQNYEISQIDRTMPVVPGEPYPPADVVADALRLGCRSISYTYTEPTVFLEYAYDTAQLAVKAGLRNILVTNGYTGEQPLRDTAPLLAAANVDLKGFTERFYRELCGATLQGVLDTLVLYRALGIWVEVTTLVIPGHNDSDGELRDIARFIKTELGADTPWHVSAFHPTYRLTDAPPTPPSTLRRAREAGMAEGLSFVYTGNIHDEGGETTYCPSCRKPVIVRRGYRVVQDVLDDGRCPSCRHAIAGRWS